MTTATLARYQTQDVVAALGDWQVATQDDGFADWEATAGDWLKNLASDRTRSTYLEAWKDFLAFAGKLPDQVAQGDCIGYRYHLKTDPSPKTGKPFSQSTVNLRLSAVSSFYAFAVGRGLRPDNPVDGVKREAVTPYGRATWLSPEEGEDLAFLAAIDPTTDQGRRDYALVLIYLTGAFRVSEVANLAVGDLRRLGRRLFVTYRRKGGKVEEVELAHEAADAIDAYLATRPNLTPLSPLFVAGDQGRRAAAAIGRYGTDDKPLTTRAIRYLVKTYARRAFGNDKGIRPHSLRHTAAQAAILEGATIGDVSRLLKHANLGITSIYMHATSKSDAKTAALLGSRYGRRIAAAD